jgi:hypothetical protein
VREQVTVAGLAAEFRELSHTAGKP